MLGGRKKAGPLFVPVAVIILILIMIPFLLSRYNVYSKIEELIVQVSWL